MLTTVPVGHLHNPVHPVHAGVGPDTHRLQHRPVSHVSRPRVTCHLPGQLGPRLPHHGEVVYPVEAPPVQHGRGGVQLQLQPGQLRGVEAGCST